MATIATTHRPAIFAVFRTITILAYYVPHNFIRVFDALGDRDVMAIYGWLYADLGYNFWGFEGEPSMADVLLACYGDALQIFDMRDYLFVQEPVRMDVINIDGTEIAREFWRLEDAYEHFRDAPWGTICFTPGILLCA